MKFYELIEKVDFDKLPFCNDAPGGCIYDMLRHTKAGINDDKIYVTWLDTSSGKDDGTISVYNCDVIRDTGDHIQQLAHHLGKDIVLEDDIKLSDEELLAKILWELTSDIMPDIVLHSTGKFSTNLFDIFNNFRFFAKTTFICGKN